MLKIIATPFGFASVGSALNAIRAGSAHRKEVTMGRNRIGME
jgi:hypothetical protein